jgi:hypothetical protein
MTAPWHALRGLAAAVRHRRKVFVLVAASVLLLDTLVPPVLLSLTRKPMDFFTFNPWLRTLPDYLVSGRAPLGERLQKTWGLALFWFSADNPYGVEWGFAVTVGDLARFALMALLIGAYFALWSYRRERVAATGWGVRTSAQGGVLGALSSVFGLAAGGCTVMGCGAPVIPVVGLAFVGLSSTTLKWLAGFSIASTAAVFYLAWRVDTATAQRPRPLPGRLSKG